MPYTLDLPPDIEAEMREEAMRRNVGFETFASDWLARSWRGKDRRAKPSPLDILTSEEKQTLTDLNAELSRDFWLRYNALNEKLDAARHGNALYTEEDRQEGIRCAEIAEEWNVRRITTIATMAKKRAMKWTELMQHLQITCHPDAMAGR